jgi:hypothetical protein
VEPQENTYKFMKAGSGVLVAFGLLAIPAVAVSFSLTNLIVGGVFTAICWGAGYGLWKTASRHQLSVFKARRDHMVKKILALAESKKGELELMDVIEELDITPEEGQKLLMDFITRYDNLVDTKLDEESGSVVYEFPRVKKRAMQKE